MRIKCSACGNDEVETVIFLKLSAPYWGTKCLKCGHEIIDLEE